MKKVFIRGVPEYFIQERKKLGVSWLQVIAAGIQAIRERKEKEKTGGIK